VVDDVISRKRLNLDPLQPKGRTRGGFAAPPSRGEKRPSRDWSHRVNKLTAKLRAYERERAYWRAVAAAIFAAIPPGEVRGIATCAAVGAGLESLAEHDPAIKTAMEHGALPEVAPELLAELLQDVERGPVALARLLVDRDLQAEMAGKNVIEQARAIGAATAGPSVWSLYGPGVVP